MQHLFTISFLALSVLSVRGRGINVAQPDHSLDNSPSALIYELVPPKGVQEWHEESWEKGPLMHRWRQWIRRQDDIKTPDDDNTATKKQIETRETTELETTTTQNKATTIDNKATTTQDKLTNTEEPKATTEEPTTTETSTQESSLSSTVLSTSSETSSDSSSTTSSILTTTEPGASCYSTTVHTTVVCSVTTGGHTKSIPCVTAKMTSSACSPGLLCTDHPDSGVTVCMKEHNEIGTEGIVVGAFFGACISGCIAVLVGMCMKDKRVQKRYHNMKRVRTLRAAGAAAKKPEDKTNLMAGPGS